MSCRCPMLMLAGVIAIVGAGVSSADELSIHDVQFTTDPAGASPYDGQIHTVLGGVVTHVWSGFNDRVYLQDPAHPTWGAIVVKDAEFELIGNVQVGDWVRFDNIYIEEYRGTTLLQYRRSMAPDVSYSVLSSGNPVPEPTLLTAADIPGPIYDPDPVTGGWFVADHATEPYESMAVTLENVTVGQRDLGKEPDNYELWQGSDVAWGTDYMNIDAGAPYDPRIVPGAQLESITGIVEQYTRSYSTAPSWDYYQLNTRFAADIVPEPATLSLLLMSLALTGRRR